MDHAPSSTGRKQLKVSILPNKTAKTKTDLTFKEEWKQRTQIVPETKITPIKHNKLQQLKQNTQPNSDTVELQWNRPNFEELQHLFTSHNPKIVCL